jgi:YVTN family beta-propeller protein
VVGSYDVVSVIDISDPSSPTYNKEIATIPIAAGAWNVATNSDGSLVYVTLSDGKTVTVIDTASNTVIGRLTTDQSGVGVRSISVGANDMLYVTDGYDGTIYAVTLGGTTVL